MTELRHADRAEVLALAAAAVPTPACRDLALPLALVDPPLASRRDVALAQRAARAQRDRARDGARRRPWMRRLLADLGAARRRRQTPPTTPRRRRRCARCRSGSSSRPTSTAVARPATTSVECLSAPGEGRECVEVARVVLAHAERGTPFDRIAIVMRAPELYASHLETALRRADIPAYFGRGTRRPDPAGRAMLALLACAVEGLSARRFAEYLSLGQVPALRPGVGEPPRIANRRSGVDVRRRCSRTRPKRWGCV